MNTLLFFFFFKSFESDLCVQKYPIAKLLDHVLHDESEETGAFNRGELSALVRIQYEERLAFKQRNRIERESFGLPADQRLSLDLRNSKRISSLNTNGSLIRNRPIVESQDEDSFIDNQAPSSHADSVRESIHIDEVAMVEGALQMKTKTAWEVCNTTKIYSIPSTTILDQETVVSIYSQGYSRIPVSWATIWFYSSLRLGGSNHFDHMLLL